MLPPLPRELSCNVEDKDCKPACPFGVLVPDRDINQAEAETYWRQDRAALKTCRSAHRATVVFYQTLQEQLRSPEK